MKRIFLASTGLLVAACYSSAGTSSDAAAEPDAADVAEAGQEIDHGCPTGLVECSGLCVDILSDAYNCGACSNSCGLGSACRDGLCRYPCEATCHSTQGCCNDVCVYTNSDDHNCGGCGITCPGGSTCRDGQCVVETCPIPCPAGYTCCIDTCVDTSGDLSNCGWCGFICDTRTSDGCFEGNCSCRGALECRIEQMCCPGLGCRSVLADPSNCGGCGTACDIGETCVDGRCSCSGGPPCPWSDEMPACMNNQFEEFQMCCDGACVQVGDGHCGECGLACGPGTHCEAVFMSTCRFSCTAGP